MLNDAIIMQAKLELSRRDFWQYCKTTSPDFYKEERHFLKDLAQKLQWFVEEADERAMVINMPPRFGKSRTATKFVQWLFGKYGSGVKVMTGSYNETLSGTFAKAVRDTIAAEPTAGALVYRDIFPDTKIKYGEAAAQKWALDGSEEANYLATSPTGTATGFGCTIMLIDDLIKNAEEAYNENRLQQLIDWFNNTMLSRVEPGFKIIIIMTRWATNDLAGHVLAEWENVVHIDYKAIQPDGTMLCDDILTREDYELKTRKMNKDIASANYQQEPMDVKGRLYSNILTYTETPEFDYILNYTDTADEGSDFLCSICYGMKDNFYYVLDVLYTKAPMELTEPATADMLTRHHVGNALIESNNGGRGFGRNVERELRERGNNHTEIKWFHQNKNKKARILSNSTGVMKNVLFPAGWQDLFPDFARDVLRYQKEGKNAHDDGPDALTGVYENPKPKTGAKLNTGIRGGF